MTREEAITYLNVIWNRYKAEYEIERETLDAYHMAIESLSADAEPSEQYRRGFEDAKRSFLVELARESLSADVAEWQGEIVRCRNCKWEFICRQTVEQVNADDIEYIPLEWCSYGERKE